MTAAAAAAAKRLQAMMPGLRLPEPWLVLPPLRHGNTPQPRIHLPSGQHLDHQHPPGAAGLCTLQQCELRGPQGEGLGHQSQQLLLRAAVAGTACEVHMHCLWRNLADGGMLLAVLQLKCDLAVA